MKRKRLVSFIILLSLMLSVFHPYAKKVNAEEKLTGSEQEDDRILPENPQRPASNTSYWEGDYVYFGKRKNTAMKWRVLQNDGKNLLLMADKSIGSMAYHNVDKLDEFEFTYESSTIREWLNNDFIKETFTEDESAYLMVNQVCNGYSQYYKVDSGPDTSDKVYLLSYKEMKKAKYGFWSAGGKANSRVFYDLHNYVNYGTPTTTAVWTRTFQSEVNNIGDRYAYPWWIEENGELNGRGAWFTHPVTWDKGIMPVIKIPVSCPFWSNEPPEYESSSSSGSPAPTETAQPDETKWKLKGLDFECVIPKEIPALGGGKISFDMDKLPIEFSQDGNQFRMAIGVTMKAKTEDKGSKGLFDLKLEEWKSFKKWAESFKKKPRKDIGTSLSKLKDATKKGKLGLPMEASKQLSCEIAGFAEGKIEEGACSSVAGGIYIRISVKGSLEKQLIVLHIPVVVKFEIGAELTGECSINADMENAEIYTSGEITLSLPKVKASLGVGLTKIADVSGYGSLDNKLKIQGTDRSSATEQENKISLTLFGEMGVSVTALMWSYEKALWSIKDGEGWEYWNSIDGSKAKKEMRLLSSGLELEEKDLQLQKAKTPSVWYPEKQGVRAARTTKVSKKSHLLQEGGYNKPGIKMAVAEDGTKMMVYVSEQPDRKNGNHTAISYCLWNEEEKRWNEPKIIEDDGTADFYPDIKAVGNDIYVAWTDTGRDDFSEATQFDEMAQSCEISVAKYDRASDSFVTTGITNNSDFDYRPSLGTWKDGRVGVVWMRGKNDVEQENALLNSLGTNEVVYAVCENDAWEEEIVMDSSQGKAPSAVGLGQISGKDCVAFLMQERDADNRPGNEELYVGEAGTEPEKLELEDKPEGNLQFVNINGTDLLTWYSEQSICYMNNYEAKYVDSLAQDRKITSDYKIVSEGNTSILLFSNTTEKENGTELYASVSKDSAYFFAPILLTDEGGYINGFDAIADEGKIQFVYGVDDVTVGEDCLDKTVKIYESSVSQYHDLGISSCTIDEEQMNKGKLKVDGIIANNGFYEEKNPLLKITCDDDVIYEGSLNNEAWIGQTMRFYGSLDIPETIKVKKGSVIRITALPAEGEDPTPENNLFEYTVEQTDLDLTVDVGDAKGSEITATVSNQGIYDVDAVLNVREASQNGTIIKTIAVETLSGGDKKELKIDEKELLGDQPGRLLYFELVSGENELYESNNISIHYLGEATSQSPTPALKEDSTLTITAEGNLTGILQNKNTVQEIRQQFDEADLVIKDANGKQLTDSDLLGTGATVSVMDGATVKASCQVVLVGDINGDGKVNGKDVSKLAQSLVGKATLTDAQKKAGEVFEDGKINGKDVSKLAQSLVGKATISSQGK